MRSLLMLFYHLVFGEVTFFCSILLSPFRLFFFLESFVTGKFSSLASYHHMLPTHPFSTLKPGLLVLSCNAFFFLFTFYCIKFLRAFLLVRSSRAGVIRGLLFYCHHPTYFQLRNTPLPNYLSFSFVFGCFPVC